MLEGDLSIKKDNLVAHLQNLLSEYKETLELSPQDVSFLESNGEEPQSTTAALIVFSLLIRHAISSKDLAKAAMYYETSQNIILESERNKANEPFFAYYYVSCGNYFFAIQDFLYADKFYTKAVELDFGGVDLANAYYNLSLTKQRLFHDNTFIIYSKKAAIMYEDLGEDKLLYETYITIGIQNFQLENFEAAIEHLNLALKYMIKIKNKKLIAQIYYNLGHTYHRLTKYEEAIRYYKAALNLIFATGIDEGKSYLYRNLCQLYLDKGDLEQVNVYIELARQALIEEKNTYIEYELKAIEAKKSLHLGNTRHYEICILALIEECKHKKFYKLVESFANELGDFYYKEKRYKEASQLLLVAIETQNKLWRRNNR